MSCLKNGRSSNMQIPKRRLGKTGEKVSILGLGGEGVLRTEGRAEEAGVLINLAIDLGINYFDCARAYLGSESYYGSALGERRDEIFLAGKSHARTRSGALNHLDLTLRNLKTDYLDLWQVHDVQTQDDVERIFSAGGAVEAFVEARDEGRVRFIGITGHLNPEVILDCIERFDFDTVLLPINPAEPAYMSFIEGALPAANKKGLGLIGMKVYLKGFVKEISGFQSFEPYFRYALTHPISTAIIGCDTVAQLEENVEFAGAFEPLSKEEMSVLVDQVFPYSRRLMYYKA